MTFANPLPKGFVPFHMLDGSKVVVLPDEDGKRTNVVWAHADPLAEKVKKHGSVQLGPRHDVSVAAWAGTKVVDEKPAKVTKKAPAKRASAAPSENGRSRGRPRKDGLATGSEAVGILKHAHETRTPVPQEVLDQMTPEARLVEEAYNARLESTSPRRGRPRKDDNVVPIKKASKAVAAASESTGGRKLLRRAAR